MFGRDDNPWAARFREDCGDFSGIKRRDVDWDNDSLPVEIAYKYVDLEHAAAVQLGSLKIGTLRSYSRMEDDYRSDLNEGLLRRKIRGISFRGDDEKGIAAAAGFGYDVGGDPGLTVTIQDCVNYEETREAFCFCASRISSSKSLLSGKAQAIFRISNFFLLAKLLRAQHRSKFKTVQAGWVHYFRRELVDYENAIDLPACLIKEMKYKEDYEIRIAFHAAEGIVAEPFITPPNAEIAALFTRVD